ncbi:MAG: FABP family protein [Propionibacteriaceae bacterium]
MHPSVTQVAPLLGVWRGQGHGSYPTIADFDYDDEVVFTEVGKPFLHFVQRTTISGEPRHTETGYWRTVGPGEIEICLALPTGQVEVGIGTATATEGVLSLETEADDYCTPRAKYVSRTVRRLRVEGDTLTYEVLMAAVGQELTLHLRSTLTRVQS